MFSELSSINTLPSRYYLLWHYTILDFLSYSFPWFFYLKWFNRYQFLCIDFIPIKSTYLAFQIQSNIDASSSIYFLKYDFIFKYLRNPITCAPKNNYRSPGWCGSMDSVAACEPKGHQFDSQLGHMPRMWDRSPVGSPQEATTHWCFSPSLSPSIPLSKKVNK